MINTEFRQDKNILIITFSNPYDQMKDTIDSIQELSKRLDANDRNLHYVADMSQIKVSFADLVQGLAQAYRTPGSVFTNPRLINYIVGDDELVRLGAKAASEQEQYGKVPMKIYTSVEDAIKEITSH